MPIRILKFLCFSVILSILACSEEKTSNNPKINEDSLMELLSSDSTGITFNNIVEERIDRSYLTFNPLYNGGGVALGDINNDNLLDILFTGNDVQDKLYLNKGNFKFEDVSQSLGLLGDKGWHNGASFVDINCDGLLDIYICRGGIESDENLRENLLYINEGNLQFREEAEKFGLNDKGYSFHSSFFDFDNDGDLDVYVINHPDRSFLDAPAYRMGEQNASWFCKDHLYRNDNGHFTDVSKESGIFNNYGFGLSVITADLNDDGFQDIFVGNDYKQRDYMYINNGDGSFTESLKDKTMHISLFSMGADYADINNDGLEDLFVSEMMPEDYKRSKTMMADMSTKNFNSMVRNGLYYQYMHNVLQLNMGNGMYSEIAQLTGISKTDWSWSCFLSDFDNDGMRDLFVSNGYRRDVYDRDSQKDREQYFKENNGQLNDLNTFLSLTPVTKTENFIFKNKGNFKFEKKISSWGFNQKSFSNGASVGDLDNDGDLDIVVNNIEDQAFIYRNKADKLDNNYIKIRLSGPQKNKNGIGAIAKIKHNNQQQIFQQKLTRGYLASSDPIIHFGIGKSEIIDEIEVIWSDKRSTVVKNVNANQVIDINYKDRNKLTEEKAQIPFFKDVTANKLGNLVHKENNFDDFRSQVLLPHKLSKLGPALSVGDLNNDGKDDFYIGGAKKQAARIYIQTIDGKFKLQNNIAFFNDSNFEDVASCLFDIDSDGDLDIYVVSGDTQDKANSTSYLDRLYLNDGTANYTRSINQLPKILSSGSCVEKCDFDNDGDLDLFVGGRIIPDQYPKPADSHLLMNDNGTLIDVTESYAPFLKEFGMVSSAVWTDINKDDYMDLIIVGEWMPIKVLINKKSKFVDSSNKYKLKNTNGWWNKIIAKDLDNDGDDDYIVGNLGLNYKFKASKEKPFQIYSSDFDNNGSYDIVLAKYNGNDQVPVRGKQCTSEQMPFVNEKFPSYNAFADATLGQIFDLNSKEVLHLSVTQFASVILWNNDNKLNLEELPIEAQFSSTNAILVEDFDNDNKLEVLIAGNMFDSEVETTRADASLGLLMKESENNSFEIIPNTKSGLFLKYNVRNISNINISGKNHVLVACNNDQLRCLSY